MASGFRCRSCALQFTVGWRHYPDSKNGYGGVTHFVCVKCGTEHAIEIALRDRGPKRYSYFNIFLRSVDDAKRTDAMQILQTRFDMSPEDAADVVRLLPMQIAHRVDERITEDLTLLFSPVARIEAIEIDSSPNPTYGSLQPDRLLSAGSPCFGEDVALEEAPVTGATHGPNREIELDTQPCTYCGATASLVGEPLEIGGICPSCGEAMLEGIDGWKE